MPKIQMNSFRSDPIEMFMRFPEGSQHPLYEVLAYIVTLKTTGKMNLLLMRKFYNL